MKQNDALIIGVTGGIGSGKSTALNIFSNKYKSFLIKADDIGNDVKLKGKVCYDELVKLLSDKVLSRDGEIDKKVMAEMIFADDDLLKKVNEIIHPAVRVEIERLIEANKTLYDYIFVEAALLCEADYFPILNVLFEVKAEKQVRIQRLMENRGYSFEKCNEIIDSQSDDSFYKKASDDYENTCDRNDYFGYFCIKNNKNEEDLTYQIEGVMEDLNERIR